MGKGQYEVAAQTSHWMPFGVALQLALDTFINVYREVLALQTVITRNFGLPMAVLAFTKNQERTLNHLHSDLEALVAPLPHNLVAQHHPGDGPLGQLVSDCRKLTDRQLSPITIQLSQLADKAWIEAHRALQSFVHERDLATSSHGPRRLPFLTHVVKTVRIMERFAQTWPRMLKLNRSDENILYFLLRRRHDLDALCEKGFVRGLLISLFPKGHLELRSVIVEAYTRRGFDYLIPSVESNIEELGPW